ncbi:MAG: tryptophan synthase subunit beta, partial [Gemmatimonadaceae bacterium]|nr:tryptophan synthase subunit beta [Gemmatimonadaceae bacterium]
MTQAVTDRFGAFGGRYVPETLVPALDELERALALAVADPAFSGELEHMLKHYVGRPTPLTEAPRLSSMVGAPGWRNPGDHNHPGAPQNNNAVAQA